MELSYKIAFMALFGLLVVAAVETARTLRARPEGRVNQWEHEVPILKLVRPALGVVFYGVLLDWLAPGTRLEGVQLALSAPVRWSGGVAALAAVLVVWWSFRSLGLNYRGGIGLWDDHDLVVRGAYRRVRHPIYTSFVLIMIGLTALSANWLLGLAGLVLTVSIPVARLPLEERQLRERFGEDYRRYEASTARFIPGLY